MLERAVACFTAQTYQNKRLYILDTGPDTYQDETVLGIFRQGLPTFHGRTIGALRNEANARPVGEIICHWDDDDWSHPRRIEEQVALLQSSGKDGKDAVGYRDMLFWDSTKSLYVVEGKDTGAFEGSYKPLAEAWLYESQQIERYVLGTSLCYWRKAWERVPFPDRMRGEDDAWQQCVATLGISAIGDVNAIMPLKKLIPQGYEPRMIASIHEGNQCRVITPSKEWRRVPEWDEAVRERMSL